MAGAVDDKGHGNSERAEAKRHDKEVENRSGVTLGGCVSITDIMIGLVYPYQNVWKGK